MLENRIDRVNVRNYRSLKDVTVELNDLTVLVGANGSGKSNFLDALRLIRDGLRSGLTEAISSRSGSAKALHFYLSHESRFTDTNFIRDIPDLPDIEISVSLSLKREEAKFEFTLDSTGSNYYQLKREYGQYGNHFYEMQAGKLLQSNFLQTEVAVLERYFILPLIGGVREIAPLYEFLSQMRFYSIRASDFRFSPIDMRPVLNEDGSNLIYALEGMNEQSMAEISEIIAYITKDIIPDNPIVIRKTGYGQPWIEVKHTDGLFPLYQESDGTLQVLGLLTALYQHPTPPLLAFEDPERMLYPRAPGGISDAIHEVSHRGQILLTTHSPDVISRFKPESLRIVEKINGATQIGRLAEYQVGIINDELFSGGDLLRIEGLKRE